MSVSSLMFTHLIGQLIFRKPPLFNKYCVLLGTSRLLGNFFIYGLCLVWKSLGFRWICNRLGFLICPWIWGEKEEVLFVPLFVYLDGLRLVKKWYSMDLSEVD